MKAKIPRLVLPILGCLVLGALYHSGREPWVRHRHPELGVEFFAPMRAVYRKSIEAAGFGEVTVHTFSCAPHPEQCWAVAVFEVPPAAAAELHGSPWAALGGIRDEVLKLTNALAAHEQRTETQGHPTLAFQVKKPGLHSRYRITLTDHHVYQVAALHLAGGDLPPEADRFFGTLQILE